MDRVPILAVMLYAQLSAFGRLLPVVRGSNRPIAAIHGSHLLAKTCPHLGPEHEMDN